MTIRFYGILLVGLLFQFEGLAQLQINEFQAANSTTILDPDYDNSADWIELKNTSSESINLSDYTITDDLGEPDKWSLQGELGADQILLIWADGEETGIHTSFKLSSEGEEIGVFDKSESLIDSVSFGLQKSDMSFGRNENDPSQWGYFLEPTPGQENSTHFYLDFTKNYPMFSIPGGIFNSSQSVAIRTILGGQIRYTTDGTEPNLSSSLYTQAIDLDKTTILRARIFKDGLIPGPIVTHSYFINEGSVNNQLPVVSIATDPDNFWDAEKGIYVQDFKPDWEVPINIELFETSNLTKAAFNEPAGTKVNGLQSWQLPQKMLGIYFRGRYGTGSVDHQMFPDRERSNFKTFSLRASGSDWSHTLFRDILGQHAVQENTDLTTMGYKHSIVFVNGEYMGIHNIRSKVEETFGMENFGLDSDEFDMIESEQYAEVGDLSNYEAFEALYQKDLSIEENYQAVLEQMDLENFTDLMITEMAVKNTSIGHNIMAWKPKHGGKWKWILMDLDRGFINATDVLIDWFLEVESVPFASLWQNENYRQYFADRLIAHMNTTFHPTRMHKLIAEHRKILENEIPRHIKKWEGTTSDYGDAIPSETAWRRKIETVEDFVSKRPTFLLGDLSNHGFAKPVNYSMQVWPTEGGTILLNNLPIEQSMFNWLLLDNRKTQLSIQEKPGYTFIGWSDQSPDEQGNAPILSANSNFDLYPVEGGIRVAIFERSVDCVIPSFIDRDMTLNLDCSPYYTNGSIEIDSNATLTIEPGVEVLMAEDVDMIVRGRLVIDGTESNPVTIKGEDEFTTWGALVFLNTNTPSIIQHVEIQDAKWGPVPHRDKGAISAFNADLEIDHLKITDVNWNPIFTQYSNVTLTNSTLKSAVTGDLINVKHGSAIIDSCYFEGNDQPDTDAIDYDAVTSGSILNSKFHGFLGPNSDAIDIGEAAQNVTIDNVVVSDITDKGVSVGQLSFVNITNSLFVNANMGIAAKDSSWAIVDQCTFYNVSEPIASYEKNPGRAGGNIKVSRSVLSNASIASVMVDSKSTLKIENSIADSDILPGEQITLNEPGFENPIEGNFYFKEGSILSSFDGEHRIGAPQQKLKLTPQPIIVEFFIDAGKTGSPEYIVLHNPTETAISLNRYTVSRGFSHTMDWQTEIQPGDSLYLIKEDHPGFADKDYQVWSDGKLSNNGEAIEIRNSHGIAVDHIRYDEDTWPSEAFKEPKALILASVDSENHLAKNWITKPVTILGNNDAVPEYHVYPNPTSAYISISVKKKETLQVYSMGGQLLSQHDLSPGENRVDLQSHKAGLYLLKLSQQTIKILKQ